MLLVFRETESHTPRAVVKLALSRNLKRPPFLLTFRLPGFWNRDAPEDEKQLNPNVYRPFSKVFDNQGQHIKPIAEPTMSMARFNKRLNVGMGCARRLITGMCPKRSSVAPRAIEPKRSGTVVTCRLLRRACITACVAHRRINGIVMMTSSTKCARQTSARFSIIPKPLGSPTWL